MNLFTPESQGVLADVWDRRQITHEHAEQVIRFMADLEYGIVDRYRSVQLQTPTLRRQYFLPAPGLIAMVDWHPPEEEGAGWTLDLVEVLHELEFEDQDPWQLP